MRPKILLTAQIHPTAQKMLDDVGDVRIAASTDEEALCADVAEMDAILVRHPITQRVIEAGKSLRVIARHGVGLDYIPVETATERGIPVVFTPDANTESVAEHALGMMIALAHNFPRADAAVRAGNWEERHNILGVDLRNRTLGLIGCGRIGGRLAEICQVAFGMEVLVHDPGIAAEVLQVRNLTAASFEDVLVKADFLSLHAPLTPATKGLIDAAALTRMKPTAYLINAARGGIVDTVALAEALDAGDLAGAALDVFPEEPPHQATRY